MAARQRGIPRPRMTEVDLALREAILDALKQLQGGGTLSELADDLQISVKTLSRYRNTASSKPASLGGDLLFRICGLCDERDISVACHGRILRLPRSTPSATAPSAVAQLRFRLTGTVKVDIPSRTGAMLVEAMTLDQQPEAGHCARKTDQDGSPTPASPGSHRRSSRKLSSIVPE